MRTDYLAGGLALLILVGGWFLYDSSLPERKILTVSEIFSQDFPDAEIPKDRVVVDYGVNTDGTVAYSYLTNALPERLVEKEITRMRTETSYTEFIEVVEPGEDPILKLNTVIYAQPAYAQDVDGSWKYLEYATTTEQAFRDRDQTLWTGIRELFVRTAYADTASPFSEAGDGEVLQTETSDSLIDFDPCPVDTFTAVREATAGDSNDDTSTTANVYVNDDLYYDPIERAHCATTFRRLFVPFLTSSIPSTATISAATLNVWANAKLNTTNDGTDYITVVQTSQVTHTVLANEDYDQCGALTPTEGIDSGERKDLTSVSTGAYLTFTLNATGRGWIAKNGVASNCSASAGYSCFGLREGHDTTGTGIGSASSANYLQILTSEQTGTTNDPYLSVTYTVAASVSQIGPSFQLTSGGLFEVGSSGLFEISER